MALRLADKQQLVAEVNEVAASAHSAIAAEYRGLSVAQKLGGVNVNLLAADGPENVEELSGMAQLTGIRVRVEPARAPVDPTSWSGMPPEAPRSEAH